MISVPQPYIGNVCQMSRSLTQDDGMDFIIRNAAAIERSPREYEGADSTSQSFFSFPTEFVAVHLLPSIVEWI